MTENCCTSTSIRSEYKGIFKARKDSDSAVCFGSNQSSDHPADKHHQNGARQRNTDLSLSQTEVDVARQPPQPEFREPGNGCHEDDEKYEYCENPAHPRIVRPEPCSTNSLLKPCTATPSD